MDEYESLNHRYGSACTRRFSIPKCRRRTLYVELRKYLGEVFCQLVEQKESRVEEGHLMPAYDAARSIEVSGVAGGFIKGKSEIHPATSLNVISWDRVFGQEGIRLDRGSRRTDDLSVCPQSRGRGSAVGAAFSLPPSDGHARGAASATLPKPLRAAHITEAPALPGILTLEK